MRTRERPLKQKYISKTIELLKLGQIKWRGSRIEKIESHKQKAKQQTKTNI